MQFFGGGRLLYIFYLGGGVPVYSVGVGTFRVGGSTFWVFLVHIWGGGTFLGLIVYILGFLCVFGALIHSGMGGGGWAVWVLFWYIQGASFFSSLRGFWFILGSTNFHPPRGRGLLDP